MWCAFDLHDLQYVAVKIHRPKSSWKDEEQAKYIKYVRREYAIHCGVNHPNILPCYGKIELGEYFGENSFGTVLEYCEGTDLSAILDDKKRLPEGHARVILLQILSGMQYLSSPSADRKRRGVIHYDLKPGNILIDGEGNAKITDFGLSKIVVPDAGDSLELTSLGAGTVWYLPPECFPDEDEERVLISNKVDVWSIGVIFFEMLYGEVPYGLDRHGRKKAQDRIKREKTIVLEAQEELRFPINPNTSDGAKNFIRACLTFDPKKRRDMNKLCEHEYVTSSM